MHQVVLLKETGDLFVLSVGFYFVTLNGCSMGLFGHVVIFTFLERALFKATARNKPICYD